MTSPVSRRGHVVAPPGLEPGSRDYETRMLPLQHDAISFSGHLLSPDLENHHAVFRVPNLRHIAAAQNLPDSFDNFFVLDLQRGPRRFSPTPSVIGAFHG